MPPFNQNADFIFLNAKNGNWLLRESLGEHYKCKEKIKKRRWQWILFK
jgi:hypothetical protein